MCMHCRSLWSRINNLLVIDQYIYLGCPIATQGHSTILEKKNCQTAQEPARSSLSLRCLALPTPSPPNTATGKIRSIERDRCCRPLMSHGRSATVETSSPSVNGASRSLTRVTQRFAAAIPSYFANVVGVGYWPSRYSTAGLIELGRHGAAGRRRSHYRCIMCRRPCQHRRLRFPNQLPVRSMHTRRRWCVHTSHGSLY